MQSTAPMPIASSSRQADLLIGVEATSRLFDPDFGTEWAALHGRSAYATVFQSPGYCRAWYESYAAEWEPVVALRYSLAGHLIGAWFLARHRVQGTVTHAGAHQAEYHAWLHEPGDDIAFVAESWKRIVSRCGVGSLRLRYFPSADIGGPLQHHPALAGKVEVRPVPRPLMRLDAAEVAASFAKKSNRSRFNRLARLGEVTFGRVQDAPGFDAIIEDLELFYDLRQEATNGTAPFREDPLKRLFHRRLVELAPEATHVTTTSVGGRPVAGLWAQRSGDILHLGMLFHSPVLAEHSPGKLHVMRLAEHMLREGLAVLDLTPGGDPWKERFANAHDTVTEVTLHASAVSYLAAKAGVAVRALAKRGLSRVGVTPADIRSWMSRVRPSLPFAVIGRVRRWWREDREFRAYRLDRETFEAEAPDERIRRNELSDLLEFKPSEPWHRRSAFLSAAMARLEDGQFAYTSSENGVLTHFGWLALHQAQARLTEVDYTLELPAGSATLYDFYTHPASRGRGLYRASLRRMLNDAFSDPKTQHAWIFVLAENRSSRRAIETVGFRYVGSCRLTRRFGGQESRYESAENTGPAQGGT